MFQTLNFNGPRQVNIDATFFRYESGTAGGTDEAVRVRAGGQDLGEFYPGDSVELPISAQTWEITPVNPITSGKVRLGMGRVQSARLSGVVRVVDEITDAMTTFTFLPPLAVAAFQVTQVVAPSANARGIILRQAYATAQSGSGGSANASFIAAKSTPVSFSVPAQRYNVTGVSNNNGQLTSFSREMNKLLPPGWGIYAVSDIAGVPALQCNGGVGYELL